MRNIFTILLIIISYHNSFSQNVYYDAKALRTYIKDGIISISNNIGQEEQTLRDSLNKPETHDSIRVKISNQLIKIDLAKKDKIATILIKYKLIKTTDIGKPTTVLDSLLRTNPFFTDLKFTGTLQASGSKLSLKAFGAVGGSISGIDVTKFANAVSDLLIDRAKQELTVAFFDRFKKFSEENPEFRILFPKSTDNLRNLLTYQYPQMLPALRAGFLDDLRLITYHLDDVLELPKYRELLINFPEIRIAIKSLRLIHELENGTSNLAEVINDFADFSEWKTNPNASPEFINMRATVEFSALFSEALRSHSTSKDSTIWITPIESKAFVRDPVTVQIFMGLLWQQIKDKQITFKIKNSNDTLTDTLLTDILRKQKESIFLFQSKITEFINLSDKFTGSYWEVKSKIKNKEKPTNENIYDYINVSLDVVDYAFSIVKIFDNELLNDQFIKIPRKANSLYKDVYSEQYTQAVNDAIDLLSEVYELTKNNTKYPNLLKDKQTERARNPGDLIKIDSTIAVLKKIEAGAKSNLDSLITFTLKVKPYALFMANMVESKDENAVKAALDNVILPVGSSSIKKNQERDVPFDGNISVQSYVGASWRPSGNRRNSIGAMTDKFGVIAPIGISYTPGFASLGKSGSVSLFVSLLDLGAIVDYKLKIDSTVTSAAKKAAAVTKDYSIELGQIFSPGAFLVYGFGNNLPMSLGVGAQFGPGLSKIDVSGSTTILNEPKWRFNIFLAVDLTLFTLRNRLRSGYTPVK